MEGQKPSTLPRLVRDVIQAPPEAESFGDLSSIFEFVNA